MQINNVGLYIKLSLENLESLLRIGEKINVKIIEKLDNNNYLIKIKGQALKAYSTVNFKSTDKAVLIVEKMKPSVILRLVDEPPKDFISTNKLKIDMAKVDTKRLELPNIQKQDPSPLRDIADKIKTAVDMFKSTAQLAVNRDNFFIQVPVVLNKIEQNPLFIRYEAVEKEDKNSKKAKNGGIRIVLYAAPEDVGDIKVDMLYANNKIRCSLFGFDKKSFEILTEYKDELENLLGENSTLNIDMLSKKPAFLRKQVDLKI